MAAANATHAYHLLLTGINKNLIWGNYEKPTHYAIWFMFWHVAIIGLIAEKPSFPELYGLCFNRRASQSPCLSQVFDLLIASRHTHRFALWCCRPQPERRCDGHSDRAALSEMVFGYYKKLNSDLSVKRLRPTPSPHHFNLFLMASLDFAVRWVGNFPSLGEQFPSVCSLPKNQMQRACLVSTMGLDSC